MKKPCFDDIFLLEIRSTQKYFFTLTVKYKLYILKKGCYRVIGLIHFPIQDTVKPMNDMLFILT